MAQCPGCLEPVVEPETKGRCLVPKNVNVGLAHTAGGFLSGSESSSMCTCVAWYMTGKGTSCVGKECNGAQRRDGGGIEQHCNERDNL